MRHNAPLRGERFISRDINIDNAASDDAVREGSDGEDTFDGYWDDEEKGSGDEEKGSGDEEKGSGDEEEGSGDEEEGSGDEDAHSKSEDVEGDFVGKVGNEESDIVENLVENAVNTSNATNTKKVTDKNIDITKERSRFECDICKRIFVFKKSFQKHMAKHGRPIETIPEDSPKPKKTKPKPKQPTLTACQYCGKMFKCQKWHKAHEMTHRNERPFQCRHCSKTFARKPDLDIHEKAVHLGLKEFKCQYCDKAFSRKWYLPIHEATHTQSPSHAKPSHQCSICSKMLGTKHALKQHIARHKGDKPHQCCYCHKRFVAARDLIMHERTHTGEKPFKCKTCDYACSDPSSLVKHERIHTGKWISVCKFCGKGFTSTHLMKEHESSHTGVKAIKCRFCERLFRTYKMRERHEITHTGERNWKCRYCDMCFKRKDHCRTHEHRKHRNEPGYEPAPLNVRNLCYVGPEKRRGRRDRPSKLYDDYALDSESGAENSREPGNEGSDNEEEPGTIAN